MQYLPAIEIETGTDPEATVIWLHGLGADGNDFAPIVPELRLPQAMPVRFIFPHAPAIPVTVNGGFVMPAWYDISAMEIDREIDTAGLIQSAQKIEALIEREYQRGMQSSRIIVAGFSQGGAVAYQVALSHSRPLAGLLAMSTYFATAESVDYSAANLHLPIQIQHGLYDPVVPEILGQKASRLLTHKGYLVNYQTYPMEHGVCPEQISDIGLWLGHNLRRSA